MPINPDTLKRLRERKNFSQQALADRAKELKGPVGKRTIVDIECRKRPPERVRGHTIACLAKALGVKPEVLCKPVSEISDEEWKGRGYTPIKFLIPEAVRQSFRWVRHHYDIDPHALVEAAPWMFTLLAEMSLAARRRNLTAAEAAFEGAMDQIPEHLSHGTIARSDFEDASGDESDSLASRDIVSGAATPRS